MRGIVYTTALGRTWIGLFLVFSLTMLTAIFYQLWWKRDRILYGGKTVSEQRTTLFGNAGLNAGIVPEVEAVSAQWPDVISYQAAGQSVNRSYVEYILAPRVPKGHDEYAAVFEGADCTLTPLAASGSQVVVRDARRGIIGFPLSVLLFIGVVVMMSRLFRTVSFVECAGLSAGLLLILVLGARCFLNTSMPALALFVILGFWGLLLSMTCWRSIPLAWNKVMSLVKGQQWRSCLMVLALTVIGVAVLLSLMLSVVVVPDDWDAWAIWGPKAKVLALGAGPLSDVTYFGHADYPLLWPAVWAFAGWCGGAWEEQWSRGWGAVFFALTAWQLASVVSRETGSRLAGLSAAAGFVSIPKVLVVSTWSYAEAPLWFLTALWFGRLLQVRDGSIGHAWWAGLFAALAAMTKNEGVLIMVLGLAWLMASSRQKRWVCACAYLVPVVVMYGPWAFWVRHVLGLGDHATAGFAMTIERVQYACDRLIPAGQCLLDVWLDVQQWAIGLLVSVLASGWFLWRGPSWIRGILLVPWGMWAGYFVLIVFHPADVSWQMSTSWDRLTIQGLVPLWMVVVMACWPHLRLGDEGLRDA